MTYDNNWKNNFNNDYLYNSKVGWRDKTDGERFTNTLDEYAGPVLTFIGEKPASLFMDNNSNNWKNNFDNDYIYNTEFGWREKTEGERNGPTTHFTNKLDEHLGPGLTFIGEGVLSLLLYGATAWVAATVALSVFDVVTGVK